MASTPIPSVVSPSESYRCRAKLRRRYVRLPREETAFSGLIVENDVHRPLGAAVRPHEDAVLGDPLALHFPGHGRGPSLGGFGGLVGAANHPEGAGGFATLGH